MQTTSEKKYIGSGEDAFVAEGGVIIVNSNSPVLIPDEEGWDGISDKDSPNRVYQQTEEEACCSATGE